MKLQRLTDAGLLVAVMDEFEPIHDRYIIAKPISPDTIPDPFPAYFSTPEGRVITEDAACRLYYRDEQWLLEVWECAPGPAQSDFICWFPLLDQAIDAIIAFYFGAPTIIGDWRFPLHRHPELSRDGIARALADTVNVTQQRFDEIKERRWNQVKDQRPFNHWERALQYQFLIIPHVHQANQTLGLRRDLQEAYIVRQDVD